MSGALGGFGIGWLLGGEDANRVLLSLTSLAGLYGGMYAAYNLTEHLDGYRRSAPSGKEVSKLRLHGPTPTLIPGVNPETRRTTMTPGVNLLNGTW